MDKPKFRQIFDAPIWRCGQLEIRDVKKDKGNWARTGYDPDVRYNLWAGSGAENMFPVEVSNALGTLKKYALLTYDPATGKAL